MAVIDDLDDLAEAATRCRPAPRRGSQRSGIGPAVLRAFTDLVFERWPDVTRFEGYTRDDNLASETTFRGAGGVKEDVRRGPWPVTGASRRSAVGYAGSPWRLGVGTRTTILWDDL